MLEEASVYLEIGDGGIEFKVMNSEYGPKICIQSRHYGNNEHTQNILTSIQGLKELGELFTRASECPFEDEYVYAAKPYHPEDYAGSSNQSNPTSAVIPEASCGNTICCGNDCHNNEGFE